MEPLPKNDNNRNNVILNFSDEILPTLINVKASICTSLFGKEKFTEPIDALIFGYFLGYFSSKGIFNIEQKDVSNLMKQYMECAKASSELDSLLTMVTLEFSNYFEDKIANLNNNNDKKEDIKKNNIKEVKKEEKEPEDKVQDINKMDIDNEKDNEVKNINEIFIPKKLEKNGNCLICLEQYNILDEINYGLECGCIIHSKCFDTYIKNAVEDNKIPIVCPYCSKSEVNPNFIIDSLASTGRDDLIKRYEQFSLNFYAINHNDDISCCPHPGCQYMFYYEKDDIFFNCPMCNHKYCLKCKTDWHEKFTCEENRKLTNVDELDKQFYAFVKGAKYKQCPFCKVWVEKTIGCNHMRCKCGKDFCYFCGGKMDMKKAHHCQNGAGVPPIFNIRGRVPLFGRRLNFGNHNSNRNIFN